MFDKDSNLIWEQYKTFLEAPVSDISLMGDWEDPRKRKYDDPSIKLLKKDTYIEKLKTTFAKNIATNFNLYFLKSKDASKYSEYGIISETELRSFIKDIDVSPIISKTNENTVTIIFTNNSGIDKVPLTPWMIGHRIGHVLYRGQFSDKSIKKEWDMFITRFKETMYGCYNIQDPTNLSLNPMDKKRLFKILNGLGTFRSAREKKINRPFEFVFEVFAQYFISGEITFNPVGDDEPCAYEMQSVFEASIEGILRYAKGKMFLM